MSYKNSKNLITWNKWDLSMSNSLGGKGHMCEEECVSFDSSILVKVKKKKRSK